MTHKIDLKELELKLRKSIHLDGLLEMAFGFLLLVSMLSSTLSEIGVSDAVRISIYLPLMVSGSPLIIILGKKYITNPRLGLVKFRPPEIRRGMAFIALVVFSAFLLFAGMTLKSLMPLFIFIFIMAAFSMIAFFLDFPRMYLVGLLFALTEPIYVLCRDHTDITHVGAIAYGIPGTIILMVGVISLRNFMREYSLPSPEASDGTC